MTDLWIPLMQRLGASVEELAREQIESIMGFDGKGGHKPPRADIQKMKDVYDIYNGTFDKDAGRTGEPQDPQKAKEWEEKYTLTDREKLIVQMYQHVLRYGQTRTPQGAFDYVTRVLSSGDTEFDALDPDQEGRDFSDQEATPEAKREVGAALKKYEQQHYPMLYGAIRDALDDMYRRGPLESYKLWPRMVNWIKDEYSQWLLDTQNAANRPSNSVNFQAKVRHILDIGLDGGKILDQLRRENKLPQGFDVNKVDFPEFEDWLTQWKKENLQGEEQGEVVYQFKDGYTIQKLTTPEQLQYEGDEMGHCVGGYSYQVGEGSTIIYSLRDAKGVPHVTIEMTALEGPPHNGYDWSSGGPEDAAYNHEPIHPDRHNPGDHMEEQYSVQDGTTYAPSGDKPFEVVQVMGNSNKTPKPEYQHKIREFLDYLRSKGWKFKRSDEWFAPFDERNYDYDDDGYERGIDGARRLDDWYDDNYKTHHENWQGGGEDPYGMMSKRQEPKFGDWEKIFQDCIGSLVDEYDPGRYRGNWKELALACYHAFTLDTEKDDHSHEQLERRKEEFENLIQSTEETLQEWEWRNADAHFEYADGDAERIEHFEKLMQEKGLWEAFEQKVDEEVMDEDGYETSGERERVIEELAEAEHEDLWMEANDKVRDEANEYYSGDAWKFCNYLYHLVQYNGIVNPDQLPDPNQQHGGFMPFDELKEHNEGQWKQIQQMREQTPTLDLSNGVQQGLPGAMSHWVEAANVPIEIHPIDHDHNVWFDTDGNQRQRYRPGWAKNPDTGKMEQTGELEDTFLDKHGRQGQGWVAYNDDQPVGSLTYVDQDGWHMLGTSFVHPDYREQGIFNKLVAPLRETGRPIDAYVWENPWLKQKVRSWR